MKRKIIKLIIVLSLITFLLTSTGVNAVYAFDGLRFLTWFALFSGIGSSFVGVITHGQAEKIYDEYLHSAVQSDMNRLIDDYNNKNRQSMIALRTGVGLTIGAVLISLIDASDIPQASDQVTFNSLFKNNFYTSFDLGKKDFQILISQNF